MNHAIRIIVNLLSNLIYFCVVLYVILGYTGNRNQRWFRPVADVLDAVLDRIRGKFGESDIKAYSDAYFTIFSLQNSH